MLTGRQYDYKRTFYYDYISDTAEGKWREGPELQRVRGSHSVGIVRDPATDQAYIVVAGGHEYPYGGYLNDVEILSVTDGTAWKTGNILSL